MDNLQPVYKTFKPIVGQSFGAMDVHRSIEHFVKTALEGLPENVQAIVIVLLPDGTQINAYFFGYHNPDSITSMGWMSKTMPFSLRCRIPPSASRSFSVKLKG